MAIASNFARSSSALRGLVKYGFCLLALACSNGSKTASDGGHGIGSAGGAGQPSSERNVDGSAPAGGDNNPACDSRGAGACQEPGAVCTDNVLTGCTLDADGCLIETNMDCGDDICDHLRAAPSCASRDAQSADSCTEKLFLEKRGSIAGDSFEEDYSDRHEFGGDACVNTTVNAPEAVFAIEVPAGETLWVSEATATPDPKRSLDAVFGIMAGCTNQTGCLASGGLVDRGGIGYTAETDESLVVWVSGNSALGGVYDIRIELPETLGNVGAGVDVTPVTGSSLEPGARDSFVLHLDEASVLSGDVEAIPQTAGWPEVLVHDEQGRLLLTSVAQPHFARPLEPGTYRVVVEALAALDGYHLDLFTRASTALGSFAAGDDVLEELPEIVEGEHRFFTFEVTEPAEAEIAIDAASGDPALWLFNIDGVQLHVVDDYGEAEALTTDELAPGTYLLDVLAFEGYGSIDSYTLQIDFSTP